MSWHGGVGFLYARGASHGDLRRNDYGQEGGMALGNTRLAEWIRRWSGAPGDGRGPRDRQERANRAARVLVDRWDAESVLPGASGEWADPRYGEYYAISSAVHAAVKTRADAVARPPLRVRRVLDDPDALDGRRTEASGPRHPLQRLLDRPNPFWSSGELWRATETYLALWGAAYWGLERDGTGTVTEIWPLRPDRVRVLPDSRRYVRGYVFDTGAGRVSYLPEEMVWFRSFNPMDEFSGLSAVAPSRASVDMAGSALLFNRAFFHNSATPSDLAITTEETPTDEEVHEFYARWESRFGGAGRSHRPVLLSRGMDAKRLGLSHRDMEFIEGLRWAVEEVSRAFGVPKAMLGDLEDATLSNIRTEEQFLWRNTIVPELGLLEDAVNRTLSPLFGQGAGETLEARFDLSAIEALQESEGERVERQVKLLEAGVLTVNEARAERGLPPVEWGDRPG
ncbi:MAG: phage portal protein [Chloroflexota bacterium]